MGKRQLCAEAKDAFSALPVIRTVLGDIAVSELGITAPHEHLLCDASIWWRPPAEPSLRSLAYGPITLETRGAIFRNQWINCDNMRLDNEELALAEARRFLAAGGRTIVDLTTPGIGRDPLALARIARLSGINVVCAAGFYVEAAHPDWLEQATVERIAAHLIGEIRDGIGETGIRAGLIGELGTSTTLTRGEEKVLRAAAIAQQELRCGINVHLDIFGREARKVVCVLAAAGADLTRVALSHWDHHDLDLDEQRAVLGEGVLIEYDGFGRESYLDDIGHHWARDTERIAGISTLVAEGFGDQLLMSSDICLKTDLRRYGGFGYDHVLTSAVPLLRRSGLDGEALECILVRNPARLLALPDPEGETGMGSTKAAFD